MPRARLAAVVLLAVLASACDRGRAPPAQDAAMSTPPAAVPVVLADVVAGCLALLAPELTGNGVRPRLELETGNTLVEEDPDILAQVVINLIRFTLTALPPQGEMWLVAHSGEGFVHLEIGGDQAHPVADAEKVFLPFDDGGETIGLPVCFRLMRTMGGSMRFEQQEGKGRFLMSVLTAEARRANRNAS